MIWVEANRLPGAGFVMLAKFAELPHAQDYASWLIREKWYSVRILHEDGTVIQVVL
jgi:hypothetical protein